MSRILKSPYDLVAEALNADVDSINEETGMNTHPSWDSLNHLGIIVALEKHYDIKITDDEIMKYSNMQEIISLYENLIGNGKKHGEGRVNKLQRFKNALKNSLIGKVFGK